MLVDFGGGDEIRFEHVGRAGIVTLTRTRSLNALSHDMVKALDRALIAWSKDDAVSLVVLRGEGRAFCAGGDILDVYHRGKAGEMPTEFFADEYIMNARIASYPKPYISLIDGIVMGGGVGISFHGSHRIIGANTLFAMPEVGIGFFPDVGGSHLLPHVRGSFGLYLALTGDRIRAGDVMAADLGTHFVTSEDQIELLEEISRTGNVDAALARLVSAAPQAEISDADHELIERCFSAPSIAAIFAALEREAAGSELAARILETMRKRSPTSLLVTLRQIREGAALDMEACMRMEYRILHRMLRGNDFYEGVRSVLVDKGSAPDWKPARLEDVSAQGIDDYFAPLGDRELVL